jgi:hypothetical protein
MWRAVSNSRVTREREMRAGQGYWRWWNLAAEAVVKGEGLVVVRVEDWLAYIAWVPSSCHRVYCPWCFFAFVGSDGAMELNAGRRGGGGV